ncbi:oligosaccharide flippase family protein [Massilia sp. PAMC28688]|uniref:oligosaccharide flippase family protein n=1 Tax=Massilia sp. PAMC28688 TaxID=2861283 RepID=UPI001C630601|nr:oligosaccharide flippase family protein [Massilia sp. PAMC28688]QYF91980.1 oligosaccharide flippase family protein [Massilia sp. PAMC28688]
MIRRNAIANMLGRAWGVLSVYLFLPVYVDLLGVSAFGLVGFYTTLLGVLAFADLGFTATLNREMARLAVLPDAGQQMRTLVRTYEMCYLVLATGIGALIWLLAPAIAADWLNTGTLAHAEVVLAIRVMGLAVACQLPTSLYIGGLTGLQLQVNVNLLQVLWGIYRGVGSVLALSILSPTIVVFAFAQLLANAVYLLAARRAIWHCGALDGPERARFSWGALTSSWRYSAGMAGMAVISISLTQLDKLVVSKMLPLADLGYYTLAGTLAAVPMMLASPLAVAVFPRMTALVAVGDSVAFATLYMRTSTLVAALVVPGTLAIALFAAEFLSAWTGNPAAGAAAGQAGGLLLLGQLLQALTIVPYYVALAHGNVALNLRIGVISAVLLLPLLLLTVRHGGLDGAALAWLLLNLCVFPPYMYFLHRRFVPGYLGPWLARVVLLPTATALPPLLLARLVYPAGLNRFSVIAYIIVAAGAACACTLAAMPAARQFIIQQFPFSWRRA